jgi:hypothetical protein
MNKKTNTILFILGATVVNIILMVALFTLLFVLFGIFLAPHMPGEAASIVILVLFFGSLVLTYFVYHRIVLLISKKIDMEKYFDPLFRPRKK